MKFQLEGNPFTGTLKRVAVSSRLRGDVPLIVDYGTPEALAALTREPIRSPPKAQEIDRLYMLLGRKLLQTKKAGRLQPALGDKSGDDIVNSYVLAMREWRAFVNEAAHFSVPIVDSDVRFWSDRLEGWRQLLARRGVV